MKSRPSALRDFTVDHRVWLLTVTALFIGAGASGLAVFLLRAIALATSAFYYHRLSLAPVGPAGSPLSPWIIHARQGELGMRRIQGVLQLAKQYGSAACDDACAAALELRVPEYRFVRRYLERSPQAPLSLRQVDPLIRELSQYRDLIQQRINFEESQS